MGEAAAQRADPGQVRRAMDQYEQVEFLRSQAHECRMRAAMTTGARGQYNAGWTTRENMSDRADHIEASQPDADHT